MRYLLAYKRNNKITGLKKWQSALIQGSPKGPCGNGLRIDAEIDIEKTLSSSIWRRFGVDSQPVSHWGCLKCVHNLFDPWFHAAAQNATDLQCLMLPAVSGFILENISITKSIQQQIAHAD